MHHLIAQVMLAPGDTFRAAAYEQLSKWAERSGAQMAEYTEGSKPSTVLSKAVNQAMQSESVDVLLCDTSGRYGLKSLLV